jgi:uncharacterized sulfatase
MMSVDFLPSVCALAGADHGEHALRDGEDFSATWLGKDKGKRTKTLYWLRPPDRPGPKEDPFPDLAVREGDWKLLVNEDGSGVQLYDLSKDIGEKQNLAAQNKDVAEELKKKVLEWRKGLPVEKVSAKAQGPRVDLWDDAG